MNLIQFEKADGGRAVGVVDGGQILEVKGHATTRDLALAAIAAGRGIEALVTEAGTSAAHDYAALLASGRVLPPLDHPDPAHALIAGTGLTHVASAAARDQMHSNLADQEDGALSDSMRMFKWGLAGGKPATGAGVQAEWFYKGNGSIVARPGATLPVPDFADDMGEEPEVVGLYVIGPDGTPFRLGFAIGNETTDHVMEKKSYLYLSHAKLRHCAYGPELRLGALPEHVEGEVRIRRGGAVHWSAPFATGEANMVHSIANLEYHHFKYDSFLTPGDVHVQFFGTSVASFGKGIVTEVGDVFEVDIPTFGRPLINGTVRQQSHIAFGGVKAL